jgi:hypothetical protein
LALFAFYPNKLKTALYSLGWVILLASLPLLVIAPSQLLLLYQSWIDLLHNDHSISYGLSVAGWLTTWFHIENIKNLVLLLGAIIFAIPLLKFKCYKDLTFRLFYLASILIWVVIFNHKAESPTFIIAVSGVAIWYFCQERKIENLVLMVLTFIFTILSPTDFFPKSIREEVMVHYVLKVLPCILVWFKIIYDMMFYRINKEILV